MVKKIKISLFDVDINKDANRDCGGISYEWLCPECGGSVIWAHDMWWELECGCDVEWSFNIDIVGVKKQH